MECEQPETAGLLDRARAGDAEAYGELCRVHEGRLLRQAMSLCHNPSLAEDLAQDTLVEGWRAVRRYNGRCQLFTWLCAILLNRYRNTVREKRPVPFSAFASTERSEFQSDLEHATEEKASPDEAARLHDDARLLRECVDSLPPKHQAVIYLRFYVDDSLEGIAAALGCSVGTVKSRLFNALEKLRAMRALHGQEFERELKGPGL
jgi:RNA polymerase sigma-70 factor (ECF subfamily)